MYPKVADVLPLSRAVTGVKEPCVQFAHLAAVFVLGGASFRNPGDAFPFTLIRPAGEGHWPAAEEQFAVSGGERAAEPARCHGAEIGQAKGSEVHLEDVPASNLGKPREHRGIRDGLERSQLSSSEQPHPLAFEGAPDDGAFRRAGVGGGEFERTGTEVIATAKPNGDSPVGQPTVLSELTDFVAGAFQCRERLGPRSGVGIAAAGGDVKLRREAREGEKERDAQNQRADPCRPC